ncbi:MAG: penicillin-binding protein 2 [Acidobacteriota bacterium]
MIEGQLRRQLARRIAWLGRAAQILILIVLIAGYWRVQVMDGAGYREQAENNRLRKLTIRSPRGLIFDRDGRLLAENVPRYNLRFDRQAARGDARARSVAYAAGVLGAPVEEIKAAVDGHRGVRPLALAEDLSLPQVAQLSVRHLEHPAFEIETEHRRLYRYAHQTAHLLGYLGEIGARELAASDGAYRAGDVIGKKGIERLFDAQLRGATGEQVVVVDSRGRRLENFRRDDPEPGRSLRLTLDLALQQAAVEALGDRAGAVVAMRPDGALLALVSQPAFNPNLFAHGISAADWQALLDHPRDPLQNRTIQNAYPPGSIFKIIMAMAGLDHLGVDPEERVFCRGYSVIYNHRYRCWKAAGHGSVNLREAMKGSCNVYFQQLGQRLGIDAIADYARRFGLGVHTGIALANERPGLVPDDRWSREKRGTRWFPGETISVAIGQGPILVTPIQMATLMAAIAVDGRRPTPRLVAAVGAPGSDPTVPPAGGDGISGDPIHTTPPLPIAPRDFARVRDALWAVVNEDGGTARKAQVEGLDVAGKTGTAQVVRQITWTKNEDLAPEVRDHAWFAAFAPVDDPQLVVVVFVENGGGGSTSAAPVAGTVYRAAAALGLIRPTRVPHGAPTERTAR